MRGLPPLMIGPCAGIAAPPRIESTRPEASPALACPSTPDDEDAGLAIWQADDATIADRVRALYAAEADRQLASMLGYHLTLSWRWIPPWQVDRTSESPAGYGILTMQAPWQWLLLHAHAGFEGISDPIFHFSVADPQITSCVEFHDLSEFKAAINDLIPSE